MDRVQPDKLLKMIRVVYTLFGVMLWMPYAHAGFFEVSAMGNYRVSRITDDNYQETYSYSGSISYYFWEMSALELSYTQGQQVVSIKPSSSSATTITRTLFEMAGLDLVLTFASKQSAVQPFVKFGGAHIRREISNQVLPFPAEAAPGSEGFAPSAGVGLKVRLTNTLSIKIGVDAWKAPTQSTVETIDYAGRAGISWMF